MTINTDLLVAAPMLQDYFVDKDTGKPLANGLVSLYRDTARSFYKNWYYQTGTPGAYTWVALDNPMNLSSVGTIQDPNGNDVIPFFYPYEENNENIKDAYYVTVYSVDENGDAAVLQFTRENFPYLPSNLNPTASNPVWRNYLLNNVYWRNVGTLDAMDVTDSIIAPSQHDGYTNGDIRFLKNVTGANDDIVFAPMTTTLDNDITPETMLSFTCSGVQNGETTKCIQYPISLHVNTLNSVSGTIIFHGQNVAGNPNNYVDLYFYQYLGTGALAQPDPILIQRVTLNTDFTRVLVPFITPSTDGLTLGGGGDDALFLRVQYPLSALCSINHTKPQIYFSTDVPDNDFDTYDQIESIINSPRTGDFKTSLNTFQPYGYVIANDGVISNAGSFTQPTGINIARRNIDTWPLFQLIWNGVSNVFAPIYNSDGTAGTIGASAYADWSANKQLTLTKALGRAALGLPTASTFTYDYTTSLLTVADATLYYVGSPVTLTNTGGALPPAFALLTVYYVIPVGSNTFKLAASYADALAGTAVAAGASDGTGTSSVNFALGGTFGEATHMQLAAEVGPHTHPTSFNATSNTGAGGTNVVISDFAGGIQTFITATANSNGSPFNVVQPSVYMNVFFKL
jgi:hypothetical protein